MQNEPLTGSGYNEYQELLLRPEFGFPRESVIDLLDFLWRSGERVHAAALSKNLADADDAKCLEVAVSAGADALITGNLKHLPLRECHGIQVLSPRRFWEQWSGMK